MRKARRLFKRSPVEDLSGCYDLEDILSGDDGPEGIFDVIGDIGSTALSFVPGIGPVAGGLLKAGTSALSGATAPKKPFKVSDVVKKAMSVTDTALKNKGVTGGYADVTAWHKAKAAADAAGLPPPPPLVPNQPAITPAVHLQVQPYGSGAASTSKLDIDELVRRVQEKFDGKLTAIGNTVATMSLQNQATSEHNKLVKDRAFQTKVLASLNRIAAGKGRR